MSTQKDCTSCSYRGRATTQGGWCYMFAERPDGPCAKHTSTQFLSLAELAHRFADWPEDLPEVSGKMPPPRGKK